MHITAGDLQFIPISTVSGGDTAHYRLGTTTNSFQYCLWWCYCTLQLGIYNIFPSTLSVVVIMPITLWDLKLIPIYNFRGINTAHYYCRSKTYSLYNCLWCWKCTLQVEIYNLFVSSLPVMVIMLITFWDLQLIHFNTLCGCDTAHHGWDLLLIPFNIFCRVDIAHYTWGYTTYSLQHCLWC
jgi:uncharacterized membrane protein YwzB